jgi:hypothetical protein
VAKNVGKCVCAICKRPRSKVLGITYGTETGEVVVCAKHFKKLRRQFGSGPINCGAPPPQQGYPKEA